MSVTQRMQFYFFILCFGIFTPLNVWAEDEPWPETLTLEFALKQASVDHPNLQLVNASLQTAQAEQLSVDAFTGLKSRISARLRWVDPSELAYDQGQDDHRLSLFANKRLYDFGYTASLREAAEAGVAGKEYLFTHALNQHRIAIMAAYFDVLLADLANSRDEEDMSVTFIQADRAKDRNELGMVSDIDLLEKQSISQTSRARFYRSGALQRTARANLADILNVPGRLPSDLSTPELKSNHRKIPGDVNEWLAIAEKQNPLLQAMQAEVEAAKKRLISAREITNPVLKGEVEVSGYSKESGGHDNWRAGVTLNIPLKTSGKAKAAIAKYRAMFTKAKAELERTRRQVRQAVLESWSELRTLNIEQDSVIALMDYRDLYLDRSRALYQMDVKTDLGDAMVKTSDIRLKSMQNKLSIALAWARTEVLLGKTVYGGDDLNSQVGQEIKP